MDAGTHLPSSVRQARFFSPPPPPPAPRALLGNRRPQRLRERQAAGALEPHLAAGRETHPERGRPLGSDHLHHAAGAGPDSVYSTVRRIFPLVTVPLAVTTTLVSVGK